MMPMSRRKRRRAKSTVVKRSIFMAGHRTSVSLEDEFWQSLKEIASERDMTRSDSSPQSTPSGNTEIYRRSFACSCSTSIGSKFLSASVARDDPPKRICQLWPNLILSFGHVA